MRRLAPRSIPWAIRLVASVAVLAIPTFPGFPSPAGASPTSERLYAKGLVPFHAQRWEDANRLFEQAVQSDPDDALAIYYRGLVRARLGYRQAAADDIKRALELRPELPGAALDLGILYFEQEEYPQAELWLRRAYDEPAHRFSAALFLGLTLLRRGDNEAAATYFAVAGKDPALRASARYYEGLALLRKGQEAEARRAFSDVQSLAPGSELADAAAGYLSAEVPVEPGIPQRKRWSVHGDLGFEYDSNVVLAPDDGSIKDSRGISNQSDGRVVLGAGGSYRVVDSKPIWADLSYDFTQSLHFSLNEFDLQGHRLRLDLGSRLGIAEVGASAYYDYYLLDFDSFYQQGILQPWATFFERDVAATQVYYRFRVRDFLDDTFDPYRDGYNNAVGIQQTILLGAVDRYLGFGYQFDDENPISKDGNDFQYLGHQLNAYVHVPVLDWFDALAGYTFVLDDYQYRNSRTGTPPKFGKKRQDDEHQLVFRVERPILPYLSVALEYLGIFNDSNIDEFTYNRQVISAGVRVHF